MLDIGQVLGALVLLLLGAAFAFLGRWAWMRARSPVAPPAPSIASQITELRAVGELSVFKAVSKDLLTQVDHSFGEFGRKYLSWAFTKKKLAMVFEFEMDFRYDLRSELFCVESEVITPGGGRRARITLPPCRVDVSIRSLSFYDEQRARFLPWLLPDLVQGFFDGRFSEEDKNQLIASAKAHAAAQAHLLAERYKASVERSAMSTIQILTRPLGFAETEVRFASEAQFSEVETAPALRMAA
jgi:hypothetical protein